MMMIIQKWPEKLDVENQLSLPGIASREQMEEII